jgi:heme exporter protein B
MMRAFLGATWLIARKDLTVEIRSREIVATTVFFAVSCTLVFAFSLVQEGRTVVDAAVGLLWIAIAFSGTLALGRTFERERFNDTLQALMLAPTDRPAIYIGKLLGIMTMLLAVEVVLVPLVALLFQTPLLAHPVLVGILLLLGTLGFCAVGTLFAAMLVRTRSRDVLLPVVLYPVTIPVIIAGVRGTLAVVANPADIPMALWIGLLACFDAVFILLALWTFEPVMTE